MWSGSMEIYEQFLKELNNLDLANFIIVFLLFYVPFHFSKKAESLFFHLGYSGLGVYLLFTMSDPRVIYDTRMLVGLGLLIPQLTFLSWFVPYSFRTIKMMTANTYFFFVSIYYKIIRFFNWIKSVISLITMFFRSRSHSKEQNEQSDSYDSYKNYEEQSYSNNDYKEEKKESYQEQSNNYKESNTSSNNEQKGEYSQFYSPSAYIVLGVSDNDDFSTIKKSYRALVRIYHPDLNPDDIKLYTEITQNINDAYSKLENIHGK